MKLNNIHNDLFEACELNICDANKTNNTQISHFIEEYIETDRKIFTLTWFDEFEQENHILENDIGDILEMHGKSQLLISVCDFIKNPNYKDFSEILKNLLLIQLSIIISYCNKRECYINENEIALVTMIIQVFYPTVSTNLTFRAFDYYIREENISQTIKMDAKNTIFAMNYKLFGNINNTEENEKINRIFELSPLYSDLLNNIYTQNESKFKDIFYQSCEYHLDKSCSYSKKRPYPEFEYPIFQALPCELLSILRLRFEKNLDIDCIHHPLVECFIPYIKTYDNSSIDNKIIQLRNKLIIDYNIVI